MSKIRAAVLAAAWMFASGGAAAQKFEGPAATPPMGGTDRPPRRAAGHDVLVLRLTPAH
ncbi:hypothetical protein [Ideonella sp. YS5]|uniref:hypothetical protein n=1 Tax=Ideonella sp. YS5 TaxID=3453714 RepID=UPI003EEF8339